MKFAGRLSHVVLRKNILHFASVPNERHGTQFQRLARQFAGLQQAGLRTFGPLTHWFYGERKAVSLLDIQRVEVSESGSSIVCTELVNGQPTQTVWGIEKDECQRAKVFCKFVTEMTVNPNQRLAFKELRNLFLLEKVAAKLTEWPWRIGAIVGLVSSIYGIAAPLREDNRVENIVAGALGFLVITLVLTLGSWFLQSSLLATAHSINRHLGQLVENCQTWLADVESILLGHGRLLWRSQQLSFQNREYQLNELVFGGPAPLSSVSTKSLSAHASGGVKSFSTTSYEVKLENSPNFAGDTTISSGTLTPRTQTHNALWGLVVIHDTEGNHCEISLPDAVSAQVFADLVNRAAEDFETNTATCNRWKSEFENDESSTLVTCNGIDMPGLLAQIEKLEKWLDFPQELNELLAELRSVAKLSF